MFKLSIFACFSFPYIQAISCYSSEIKESLFFSNYYLPFILSTSVLFSIYISSYCYFNDLLSFSSNIMFLSFSSLSFISSDSYKCNCSRQSLLYSISFCSIAASSGSRFFPFPFFFFSFYYVILFLITS